jgi:hypothetical protein
VLIIAVLFFIGGVLALTVKPPADRANNSRLYKIDNRVVAAVSFLVGLCFLVLSFTLQAAAPR